MPQALAVVQDVLKSDLDNADKLATILDFDDNVLGLKLKPVEIVVNDDIQKLIEARQAARVAKDWAEADRLRAELENRGYLVEDIKNGYKIKKK
jgi:cysteinyl-tRNA synthetase